jgi:homoserine dehydrogenase
MKSIGVGLLGFGTVGAGVIAGFQKNGSLLAQRLGVKPVLRRVADLDLTSDRGVDIDPSLLTTDAASVVDDASIQVVVELIGGTGIARALVTRALEQGKAVVTANKALLSEFGEEIFGLAQTRGADLFFGASVGGGIPIIRALRDGLIANRIDGVRGILNGTCNYILKRMEEGGLSFSDALAEAQAAGYAEANPALDIDGIDTAHKACILARLAYGLHVPRSDIVVEGIRDLASEDIRYARDLGYRVKLLAILSREKNAVTVRVHPALVPQGHVLASVSGVFNAVMVKGDLVGETLFYGRGAGRMPTASTVLADIADACRHLSSGGRRGWPTGDMADSDRVRLRPIGELMTRYYLRVMLRDQPGTLSRISAILGKHRISIASVLQKEETDGGHVPLVIVTHQAREEKVRQALADIQALDTVRAPTVAFRIEE